MSRAIPTAVTLAVLAVQLVVFRSSPSLSAAPEVPDRPERPEKKPMAIFEIFQSDIGDFYWKLRAANSQVLAVSPQGFAKKSDCLNAIADIKRDVPDAAIQEPNVNWQPKDSKDKNDSSNTPGNTKTDSPK